MKKLTPLSLHSLLSPLSLGLTGAAGLLLGALALHSNSSKAAPEALAPKPALTVTSTTPQTATLPIQLAANGNISAWQEASIGNESNGLRLLQVRVNVGDVVHAGQVLAVFSADSVNADLAQARAALLEASANAGEATANAERAHTLQSTGALSAQQISQYMTAQQTAQARIAIARAALASQQLRLKFTQVLAPDSGIISARTASVGAVPAIGAELFRLIRQGRLEWRAEVTASELGRIKPGTRVRVVAANGSALEGSVRMIAPTVDLQTRSALVYVDLPDSKGADAPFKAGMFASGQFQLGASSALTVPQQAVVVRDGFSYVFRLNPDQRVTQLKVATGRRLDQRLEVLGGVNAGTRIVVSGAGFLNDGDLVRNVSSPAR